MTRRRLLGTAAAGAVGVTGAGGAAARPDRWIVGTDSGRAASEVASAAASVHRELDFGEFGSAVAGRFPAATVEGLRSRAGVSYVEPDGEMRALAQRQPWGVDRIDADVTRAHGDTGSGADVAVIDTGIDSDHPDLQANLGTGKAFVSCTGSGCNYAWDDDNDHGTHVAGIVGADDDSQGIVGVAPDVTLHAVKVLNDWGGGTYSDIAAGIQYVANQGWDVGNLSLGAASGSATIKTAVQYAQSNGVLLTGSAGGSGPCSNCVAYPAAYPEVMAVGATNCSGAPASFSSSGPSLEIAAPGVDVHSTIPGGYQTWSGTSMATAFVSGTAALLAARGFTNAGARSQLCSTAEPLPYASNRVGCGLVDAAAALGYPSYDDGSC